MKTVDELKALIEARGVHEVFGAVGDGWAIEQTPSELATFVIAMQELGVTSCLEIGTGYKGGLSRFLAADLGWQVTSVDIVDYGHHFEGVEYANTGRYHCGQYDLVFIDSDNSYQGASIDDTHYRPCTGKIIAFHNIAGLRGCEGVAQYWKEISHGKFGKLKKGYHEIIEDSEQRSGIGWVAL